MNGKYRVHAKEEYSRRQLAYILEVLGHNRLYFLNLLDCVCAALRRSLFAFYKKPLLPLALRYVANDALLPLFFRDLIQLRLKSTNNEHADRVVKFEWRLALA